MKYINQIIFFLLAVFVLCVLQYQYWFGDNGHGDTLRLQEEIKVQQRIIDSQQEKNRILKADVKDLKTGLEAVEEHARLDLGYIKPNETFVQISTSPTKNKSDKHQASKKEKLNQPSAESIPEPLDLE